MSEKSENDVRDLSADEVKKSAKDGVLEIIHRTGSAKEYLSPVKPLVEKELEISGNIDSVHEFLKKRYKLFKADQCNIAVDPEGFIMIFTGNEQQANNELVTTVKGSIQRTKEIKDFPLNEHYTVGELATALRIRKHLFVSVDEYKKVFAELNSFEAAVQQEIEKKDDKRGNASDVARQKVIHNLSKEFTIEMPVFKGAEPLKFKVEIDVEASNLNCMLIAPDLPSLIKNQVDEMINKELVKEINGKPMQDFCFVYRH